MAAPHSKIFIERAPDVDPKQVELKLPSRGTDEEVFNITIKNNCPERLTYKLTGSKQASFKVENAVGFVEPNSAFDIEVIPRKIPSADDWNRFDHFSVAIAPAPKGNLWQAKDIWKRGAEAEPKQIQRFKIPIKVIDV